MMDKKVTIIGLGLIGGSLAKALRERLGIRDITAVGRSIEPLDKAVADGTISRGFTVLNDHVWESDLIFICTPVKTAMEYIRSLAGNVKASCIVTDVGSTKAEIINYVNALPEFIRFVGGHPMAGTEKTGYSSSFSHLFENAYYILTPSKSSDKNAMDFMTDLVRGIGALPVILDAEEHDRIVGSISHLPHIAAAALVNAVSQADTGDGKMQTLAAGGFRDITRIASSSPEMWQSITLSNSQQIREALKKYMGLLEKFDKYIEAGDSANIYKFFENAKNYRDTFSAGKKGLIEPLPEIAIDVVDRPGVIGEIATLLGKNGVNIKNINVSNSREFEHGCLIITLPDPETMAKAFDLLAGKGYSVYKKS